MQPFLSPYNVTYDPSNGSWNVYYLEVLKAIEYPVQRGILAKIMEHWEVQPWAFPTHGHAMHFCQPQIASQFTQDKAGGTWSARLKPNSDLKGEYVRIGQLVLTT